MGLLWCGLGWGFLRDLQVQMSLRTLVVIGKAKGTLEKIIQMSVFISAVT